VTTKCLTTIIGIGSELLATTVSAATQLVKSVSAPVMRQAMALTAITRGQHSGIPTSLTGSLKRDGTDAYVQRFFDAPLRDMSVEEFWECYYKLSEEYNDRN
jgi:hypothetical protein